MTWYKKVLEEQKEEVSGLIKTSLLITALFSFWYLISGIPFEWQSISPISQPSLSVRYLYSAFVFVTLGSFLYYVVGLWRGLYFIFVKVLKNRRLYNSVKGLVWSFLILLAYLYLVPAVVNILNSVISFVYNVSILFLYLFPIPSFFVIVLLITVYLKHQIKQKSSETQKQD